MSTEKNKEFQEKPQSPEKNWENIAHTEISNAIENHLINNAQSRDILTKFSQDSSAHEENMKKILSDFLVSHIKSENFNGIKIHTEDFKKISLYKTITIAALTKRKTQEKKFVEIAKKWFEFSGVTDIQIADFVAEKTNLELQSWISSPKNMKKLLEEKFAGLISTQDLARFFADIQFNSADFSPDEQNVIREYLETQKASSDLLEILINKARNDSQKAKIITAIMGAVSLDFLVREKIIDDARKNDIIDKIFENEISDDIKNAMTDAEIAEIKAKIQYNLLQGGEKISLTTLSDDEIIKSAFNGGSLRDEIEKIFDEQQKNKETEEENEMQKLGNFSEVKKFLKEHLSNSQKNKIIGKNTAGNDISGDDAIDMLAEDIFLEMENSLGNKGIWKIKNTNFVGDDGKKWVFLNKLQTSQAGDMYEWNEWNHNYAFPYAEFIKFFETRLSDQNTKHIFISPDKPKDEEIWDLIEFEDLENFYEILDEIDEKWKQKKFEPNCIFSLTFESGGKMITEHLRLLDINENDKTITIRTFDGQSWEIGWTSFVDMLKTGNVEFSRLGKMTSLQEFAENAYISKNIFDNNKNSQSQVNAISPQLFEEGGKISIKSNSEHGGWSVPVWGFKNPEKPHFLEVYFEDGNLRVQETKFSSDTAEKIENKNKDDAKKEKRRVGKWERINNYEYLLQFMQENGYTEPVYSLDKDGKAWWDISPVEQYVKKKNPNDNAIEDASNGGFFGGFHIMTIGDLINMGKMTKNAIEQKFEQRSKLRASESLHKLFSTFGEDNSLALLALQEFTNEVGGLIEWKMETIRRLKGKKMRAAIKDIIIKRPAKPVDVLAATMVIAESGGHLYPDSPLMEIQWERYYYFEAICLAIGLNPKNEFKKCNEKMQEKNTETAHHIHETELITRLFKSNGDNKYIQAINGGSKFWKKPPEWRNSQAEKWKNEASEFSTPDDRAEYAISKMDSNEFEITLGSIEAIAWKSTWPKAMWVWFVWAASNGPNYVHQDTANKLQSIFYGWNIFHGFFFWKNKKLSDLYKDAIEIALEYRANQNIEGAQEMYDEYKKIIKWRDENPYQHDKKLINNLWSFWKKNYKTLHPILQGADPTLAVIAQSEDITPHKRAQAAEYLSTLHGGISYIETTFKGNKDHIWPNGTYEPDNSFLFLLKKWKSPYLSLSKHLSAISWDSTEKTMNGWDRGMIFDAIIIPFLKNHLRDGATYNANPEFQKQQFLIVYEEIMDKISQKMWRISKDDFEKGMKNGVFPHLNSLKSLGFDVSYEAIIDDNNPNGVSEKHFSKQLKNNPDEIFAKFINSRGHNNISGSEFIQQKIQQRFSNISLSANDENYKISA